MRQVNGITFQANFVRVICSLNNVSVEDLITEDCNLIFVSCEFSEYHNC